MDERATSWTFVGSLDTSELVASTFELVLLLVSATISLALLLTRPHYYYSILVPRLPRAFTVLSLSSYAAGFGHRVFICDGHLGREL